MSTETLTVVVPAFCEEEALGSFHQQLTDVLSNLDLLWYVSYINDGSTDRTELILDQICASDPRTGYFSLSRNHGKDAALLAGLDHCDTDYVITMDADLQHPPSLIPQLIEALQDGSDMVTAVRQDRSDQTLGTKFGSSLFYGFMSRFSEIDITPDSSDFMAMRRSVAEAFRQLRETHRFSRGLFYWLGFQQKTIEYVPETRVAGVSKWNRAQIARYGLEGITSFSVAPLKFAVPAGFVLACLAFLSGAYYFFKTLFLGNPVPGFPTLIIVVLFFSGVQLLAIGLIGEYVGKIFQQSKRRPLYLIRRSCAPSALSATKDPMAHNQK